jgi:mRNA-degrading endonuclease RelE of RelBE toxin-antitoxin system
VVEFVTGALVQSPSEVGHPLRRELTGLWSARRGPYRVIYEIDVDTKVISVVRIDHRADVYRSH